METVNVLSTTITFVVIAVASLLVFLAIRALMLWYWKIDTLILNQEKQISLLKDIRNTLKPNEQITEEEKAKLYDLANKK